MALNSSPSTAMRLLFFSLLAFSQTWVLFASTAFEALVTETHGAQSYLRTRWHGPMNRGQAMDVTLAFDEKGLFRRGWAWSEENNKRIYYPGNRKTTQHVERGMKAPGLTMKEGAIGGTVAMDLGKKPTTYEIEMQVQGSDVKGQWLYRFGQGEAIALPKRPFKGHLSPSQKALHIELEHARPQKLIPTLGKYAGKLQFRLKKGKDGTWSAAGLHVMELRIDGDQFKAHLAFEDAATKIEGVVFWNEYHFEGQLGEATGHGHSITGSFHGLYNKAHQLKGEITGTVVDEKHLLQSNALDPAQDYPAWRGPHSDWRTHDQPYELVDQLRNAHLLWKSDPTPPGRAQDKRYFSNNHNRGIGGGGCSPILYDNKIYQFYIRPAGPDFDKAFVQRIQEAGLPLVLDQWRIAVDEYMLCLDAQTGRTLWRTRLPMGGLNYPIGSKSGGDMTPCAGEGKVFAIGSTLRIYAFDANSGEMLWENHLGSKHHHLESQKRQAIKRGEVWSWNRDNNGSPIYVDGTVVVSNMDSQRYGTKVNSALLGFDAKTGKKSWQIGGVGGRNFTPATWEHQGKTHVIATGSGKGQDFITCIDPKSGEVLWRAPSGENQRTFTIVGDHILTNGQPTNDDKKPRYLTCYSLLERGKRLWSYRGALNHYTMDQDLFYKNEVIHRADEQLVWIDLPTGKVTHRVIGRAANSYPVRIGNRALIEIDGTHSLNQYILVDLDTKEVMTDIWNPPHYQQSGYAHNQSKPIAEGRMYFRGASSIVAYDLRKILDLKHDDPTNPVVEARAILDWLEEPDLRCTWTFSDGTTHTGPKVSHRFALPPAAKVFEEWVKLTITSSRGMRRVAERKVYLSGSPIEAQTNPA